MVVFNWTLSAYHLTGIQSNEWIWGLLPSSRVRIGMQCAWLVKGIATTAILFNIRRLQRPPRFGGLTLKFYVHALCWTAGGTRRFCWHLSTIRTTVKLEYWFPGILERKGLSFKSMCQASPQLPSIEVELAFIRNQHIKNLQVSNLIKLSESSVLGINIIKSRVHLIELK